MSHHSVVVVVEDDLSEAVMRRLIVEANQSLKIDRIINERGNQMIRVGMQEKYPSASHVIPHIILTDLDQIACAPTLINFWHANNSPSRLLFRVAVRETESWLLADRHGVAGFLAVPVARIPANPETLPDPKRVLINLARRSRKLRLAQEIVPAPGSAAPIGPFYNARLSEFVASSWNVDEARRTAPSFNRAFERVAEFLQN